MRELRENDIEQVRELIRRTRARLDLVKDNVRQLEGELETCLNRLDEWRHGGDLVTGVPETAPKKVHEIWKPETAIHFNDKSHWDKRRMLARHEGADFLDAVTKWVSSGIDMYLRYGMPYVLDGVVYIAGIPVFPSEEDARNWEDRT